MKLIAVANLISDVLDVPSLYMTVFKSYIQKKQSVWIVKPVTAD